MTVFMRTTYLGLVGRDFFLSKDSMTYRTLKILFLPKGTEGMASIPGGLQKEKTSGNMCLSHLVAITPPHNFCLVILHSGREIPS